LARETGVPACLRSIIADAWVLRITGGSGKFQGASGSVSTTIVSFDPFIIEWTIYGE